MTQTDIVSQWRTVKTSTAACMNDTVFMVGYLVIVQRAHLLIFITACRHHHGAARNIKFTSALQ